MEIRSFLAFELPPQIKGVIAGVYDDARKTYPEVRWVKVDNIHLTMVFIGNVRQEDLDGIGQAAQRVCGRYGSFSISLKGAGIFGSMSYPRVLWIGLDGDLERMSHCKDALHKHLAPFGVKVEKRRFKPHLTLGRFRTGRCAVDRLSEFLSKYQNIISPVCRLEQLILFKSDLKPQGAVYSRLESWPFTGNR